MGDCGKIRGSGRIRVPDLSLETFLRRLHKTKQDLERFLPDGPPPNICDTRRAGNKNSCKIFARVLKGDCGFTFSPDMDAIAGYAEWIIEMRRKFHHGNVCYFREAFVVLSPLGKKDVFQSNRYCHIFPYLPNTKRMNSLRRLKSFRRPDLRRRRRQQTFPTANWNRLPMRGAICGKRSTGSLRRP